MRFVWVRRVRVRNKIRTFAGNYGKFSFKPRLFSDLREYNRQKLSADIMAGIIVGIVALPLAIAFGIASGVSPERGIITAIVAGFCVSASVAVAYR